MYKTEQEQLYNQMIEEVAADLLKRKKLSR